MTSQVYDMAREIFILSSGWKLWDHDGSLKELANECFNAAHDFYERRQTAEKKKFMESKNADNH